MEEWPDAPPRSIPGEVSRAEARVLAQDLADSSVTLADVVRDAMGRDVRGDYTLAQKLLAAEPGGPTSAAMVGKMRLAFTRLSSPTLPPKGDNTAEVLQS